MCCSSVVVANFITATIALGLVSLSNGIMCPL